MGMYAHYALHKLKILPQDFAKMKLEEKAFIIASIRIKIKDDKQAEKEAKRKSKR